MRKIISEKAAATGLVLVLALFVLFHLLVITGIIPYTIIWGGRFNNHSQMLGFETVSVAITLGMLAIAAMRGGCIKTIIKPGLMRVLMWVMFAMFLLNTLGNLASENMFEKAAFTPVTLILAFFSLRLALGRK
jgi:hypothetical protein